MGDNPYEVVVSGPRVERRVFLFRNVEELWKFQRGLEARLLHDEYALEAVMSERRTGRDRRSVRRGPDDRRAQITASALKFRS